MTSKNNSSELEPISTIPFDQITCRVTSQDAIGKLVAYHERFGERDYHERHNHGMYLLPSSVCKRELKHAERQLLYEGRRVEHAKLVPLDALPNELGAIEINTDGRRFSIPRDSCVDLFGSEELTVETAVVSVLDEERWPEDIYYLWPNSTEALNEIADGSLIDDVRDMAIHLKLGDRVPFSKRDILERELYARTLEKFGLDDINEVKKILKSIGLIIIDTSSRLAEADRDDESRTLRSKLGSKAISISTRLSGSSELSASAKTEVDALLEAIHKTK